jgi:two-component system nitrate/nitrite response regulator NarL
MAGALRLTIVDDRRLVREAFHARLVRDDGIEVVASLGCRDYLEGREPTQCEVLLVPVSNGLSRCLDVIAKAKRRQQEVHVVAADIDGNESVVIQCIEAGASGFTLKTASYQEVLEAIRAVASGRAQCTPSVLIRVTRRIRELTNRAVPNGAHATEPLSTRELEVARLAARGKTNKEIVSDLGIALATAKNHMHNILKKLGLRKRAELRAYFFSGGARELGEIQEMAESVLIHPIHIASPHRLFKSNAHMSAMPHAHGDSVSTYTNA